MATVEFSPLPLCPQCGKLHFHCAQCSLKLTVDFKGAEKLAIYCPKCSAHCVINNKQKIRSNLDVEREKLEQLLFMTPPSWDSVLTHLSPFTQSLFRAHTKLVSFDGKRVLLSLKNEPLLRHAKLKLNELEKAFTEVCGKLIIVKLTADSTPHH